MDPQGPKEYCARQYQEDKAIPKLSVEEEEASLQESSIKPTEVLNMAHLQSHNLLKRAPLLGQLLLFDDFTAWSYGTPKNLFKIGKKQCFVISPNSFKFQFVTSIYQSSCPL